jgi:hypothetical protein
MSQVAVASFKWLDTLELEFDKSYVDIDLMLTNLYTDVEQGDLVEESILDFVDTLREKFKTMCTSWAQLVHKSQTIFQINCKQEAQILNLKSDLIEAKAFKKTSEKELEKLMIELHSQQLQIQKLKESNSNSSYASNNTTSDSTSTTDLIQKKLEEEMNKRFSKENESINSAVIQAELNEFKKENEFLKEQLVNMNSEIYGARLAAKYLDKELTGRIQQIQLYGKNLKPEEHERLWNQLEAEIHLHRHKTVIKACRSKRAKKPKVIKTPSDHQINFNSETLILQKDDSNNGNNSKDQDLDELRKSQLINKLRIVKLQRRDTNNDNNNKKEGLGISITGGSEHGLPILISEIHENGPAHRSGELYVGDAILVANSHDLKDVTHSEAVKFLTSLVKNT